MKLPRIDPARVSQLIGVVAAIVVAVLLNVATGRHFTRWDWTSNQRYSLAPGRSRRPAPGPPSPSQSALAQAPARPAVLLLFF